MRELLGILAHKGPGILDKPLWIAGFDLEAGDGEHEWIRGSTDLTSDPSLALKFLDFNEASSFYLQQSKTAPLRPDGKINRPLCSYTVEIRRIP